MTSKNRHTVVLVLLLSALAAPVAERRAARAQSRAPEAKARAAGKALVFLDSTRERDGLRGPVRRVRTEVARLASGLAGRVTEGPRRLLEVTVYDPAGRRVENATYPVVSSLAGEETNSYDERGNLAETTLRDAAGRILSRTLYAYEFDQRGNWTKMTASLAIVGPAGPALEPVEVTYRAITYYSPETGAVASRPASVQTAAVQTAAVQTVAVPTAAQTTKPNANAPVAPSPAAEMPEEDFSALPDAGLLNQRASSLPPPAYPVGTAKPARGLVLVVVEVVIDETGRVLRARAPSGPQALREAAEEAARRAVFAPFAAKGVARRVRGTLRYTFPYEP
jgi:hypothetical protein